MNILFLGAAIVGATTILGLLAWWHKRRRASDMGGMSAQWMAEQRLTQGPDPNR